MSTKSTIRNIYLYVVSAISLFMIVFSVVSMVNLGLRTWVFTKADSMSYARPSIDQYCTYGEKGEKTCPSEEERAKREASDMKLQEDQRIADRQRDLVQNISFIIVALPLFIYHWRIIRADRDNA